MGLVEWRTTVSFSNVQLPGCIKYDRWIVHLRIARSTDGSFDADENYAVVSVFVVGYRSRALASPFRSR